MQPQENPAKKIETLHKIAKRLIDANESEESIIVALCKNGISKDYALIIIDNCLSDKRDRKDFWKLLVMGSFFVIAGLLITYFSYTAAVNSSTGFYFVYWGIVVAGIVMVFRTLGLYKD